MDRLTVEALSQAVGVIGEEWYGGRLFLIRESGSPGTLRHEGEGVLQAQKRATAAAVVLGNPHSLKKMGGRRSRIENCVFQAARGESYRSGGMDVDWRSCRRRSI